MHYLINDKNYNIKVLSSNFEIDPSLIKDNSLDMQFLNIENEDEIIKFEDQISCMTNC